MVNEKSCSISVRKNEGKLKVENASIEKVTNILTELFKKASYVANIQHLTLMLVRQFNDSREVIGAKTANDIIQDVIELFLIGKRKWDKTKGRTFEHVFYLAIISHIRNLTKKQDLELTENELMTDNNLTYELLGEVDIYEEEEKLNQKTMEYLDNKIRKILEGDLIALKVYEQLLIYPKDNKKISEIINITVAEVTSAKKRIQRKTADLFKK